MPQLVPLITGGYARYCPTCGKLFRQDNLGDFDLEVPDPFPQGTRVFVQERPGSLKGLVSESSIVNDPNGPHGHRHLRLVTVEVGQTDLKYYYRILGEGRENDQSHLITIDPDVNVVT